jgi:hypothetical protein
MGDSVLTIEDAFAPYDRLLEDSRIELNHEPQGVDRLIRAASRPFTRPGRHEGDRRCYLVALAATMMTFDKAMPRAHRVQQSPVWLLR